ncbi:efflux RND transporter permease subunit [Cecembia sp.]|uniref:efflux RND transporter permease subunit n=1 Tax=Cecembia sp. TaxID=1898110 RepID=UPI0025C478B6|nr:efflux RND transporter permease subunit [Cecembia sp.]
MSFSKASSFYRLLVGVIILIGIIIIPPKVFFDYDFESFFPQDDAELTSYNAFRERFENDNDYLLIAIGAKDVFDGKFLDDFQSLQAQLSTLELVDRVGSILDMEEVVIGPFGINRKKLLRWEDADQLAASKDQILSSERWRENLISQKGDFLLMIVHNKQQITKEDGDKLYAEIKGQLETFGFSKTYTAGKIKAQGEFVNLLQEEFAFFLAISFGLIILILFLIFRSWWTVLIAILVIAIGIVWALAFSLYFGKALDVMSVMQPTILSIIGLAALVHYFNHYLNYLRHGYAKEAAIQKSFSEISIAVFLTCTTTALGFISLYLTSVPSLKFFGLFTGIGVMLVFSAVILLTPSLLYLIPAMKVKDQGSNAEFWRTKMRTGFSWVIQSQRMILTCFLILSILSFWGLSELRVNGYILDNLPRDHELIQEFNFFDREFGGSKPLEFQLESGSNAKTLLDKEVLEELKKLEDFVQENFETAVMISPLTVVKGLNQAMNAGNERAYAVPSLGQLQRMDPYMDRALDDFPTRVLSENRKIGRISTRMEDIGSFQSAELRQKLHDFISEEIDTNLFTIQLTGTSHLIDISHESVSRQMLKGLSIAFLIVAIVAGFLFRSWRISMIVLLPNIIPLLWMCGVMWLLGVELKLTTAILFTVAFGIAVDDSIHFMTKLRLELGKGRQWLYALKRTFIDTGKAIILTTIILSSGFAVLMFSQFGVTFYSGLLISLALLFALFADLLLLPVLLIRLGKIWEKKKNQSSKMIS